MSAVTIFVCVSCRRRLGDGDDSFDQPGHGLAEAIKARLQGGEQARLTVTTVDCLAVCKRPCTVALVRRRQVDLPDRRSRSPDSHVEEIVAAALSFAASENGIVPWRERPASFRKGVIARVPPLAFKGDLQISTPEPVES